MIQEVLFLKNIEKKKNVLIILLEEKTLAMKNSSIALGLSKSNTKEKMTRSKYTREREDSGPRPGDKNSLEGPARKPPRWLWLMTHLTDSPSSQLPTLSTSALCESNPLLCRLSCAPQVFSRISGLYLPVISSNLQPSHPVPSYANQKCLQVLLNIS